jgi:nitrite reductase/ring-hydroxylating ferredoxin subunit
MQIDTGWQPVVASHFLRPADNIVAGFHDGGELALWRSAEGVAQAWENRCPHRGTRLTLARILGGRLSCAYHGWEFGADGGRCVSIPAHPAMPAPKNLCVTTYAAQEHTGMVWVRRGADDGWRPGTVPGPQPHFFFRSLGVEASEACLLEALQSLHFAQAALHTWSGTLAGQRCTVFVNTARNDLTFVHAWMQEQPTQASIRPLAAALGQLRQRAEQAHAASAAACAARPPEGAQPPPLAEGVGGCAKRASLGEVLQCAARPPEGAPPPPPAEGGGGYAKRASLGEVL